MMGLVSRRKRGRETDIDNNMCIDFRECFFTKLTKISIVGLGERERESKGFEF